MMKIDETGMTTKNIAKISQAGTFCCTEEGILALRSSLSLRTAMLRISSGQSFSTCTGGGGQAEQFAGLDRQFVGTQRAERGHDLIAEGELQGRG
jgi:hypothetical protein